MAWYNTNHLLIHFITAIVICRFDLLISDLGVRVNENPEKTTPRLCDEFKK